MNRTKFVMLGLALILLTFVLGAWGGLRQWWASMPLWRRTVCLFLFFCLFTGTVSHLTGMNPLLLFLELLFLRLAVYVICFIVWFK